MSIQTSCSHCGKTYVLVDQQAGQRVRCKQCGQVFAVPSGAQQAVKQPPAVPPAPAPRLEGDAPSAESPRRERPSRDDFGRPRPRRSVEARSGKSWVIGLVAGLVGLILLLLCGGGFGLYWVFRSGSRGGSGIPASEWVTFTVPNGGATIVMPGTPTPSSLTSGNFTLKKYLVERKSDRTVFLIAHGDLPTVTDLQTLLQQTYTAERDNIAKAGNASVAREGNVQIKGHPGKECELRSNGLVPETLVLQLFIVRDGGSHRLYELMAGGPGMKAGEGDMARFFNSFQIEAGPAGQPVAAGPPKTQPGPAVLPQPGPEAKPPKTGPRSPDTISPLPLVLKQASGPGPEGPASRGSHV